MLEVLGLDVGRCHGQAGWRGKVVTGQARWVQARHARSGPGHGAGVQAILPQQVFTGRHARGLLNPGLGHWREHTSHVSARALERKAGAVYILAPEEVCTMMKITALNEPERVALMGLLKLVNQADEKVRAGEVAGRNDMTGERGPCEGGARQGAPQEPGGGRRGGAWGGGDGGGGRGAGGWGGCSEGPRRGGKPRPSLGSDPTPAGIGDV